MTHETDLPCSDCGTALVERTLDARDALASTDDDRQVTLAVCPTCGGRYYPSEAIGRLTGGNGSRVRGGN